MHLGQRFATDGALGEAFEDEIIQLAVLGHFDRWRNTVVGLPGATADAQGVATTWNLELGSPNSVLRRGWTRKDLKVGDKISFKGFGGRAVLTRVVADAITLADGRPFTGAAGTPNR